MAHLITEDIREMRKTLPEKASKGAWNELLEIHGFEHALNCLTERLEKLFSVFARGCGSFKRLGIVLETL